MTSIGSYAFYGCFGLTSVTIGSGVTSIGDYAFQNCSGLTSVALGSGVTSIGYGAFMNCDSLLTVYYGGSQADRANLQFDYYYTTNGELLGATWYYYSAEEPALNAEGTEYDGNYWKYGDDGRPVIWKKQS